ncbi:hypothetical protein JW916_07805 [Candidatus Sumerlaeota bacterium]|nr:hypothetical protein [Candidatus Sumerlaeota bacterium]
MSSADPTVSNPGGRLGRGTTILFGVLLVLAALQNLRHPVLLDDAYITFRSARNLARGEGLVFNPGEKVLSTTAPGYAIVLAGLTRLGLETVAAGQLASTASLLVAVLLLLRLFADMGRPIAGFSAGFILCFFPDLATAWGNETSLLLALFVLAWWRAQRNRPVSSAITASVGCMVRPDFALVALILGGVFLLRSRKDFLKYALVGIALSALWLAFMYWLCGAVAPNTLRVKMEQGILVANGAPQCVGWMTFARGFRWFLRRDVFDPASGIFILIGGLLLLSNKHLLVVLFWGAAHVLVYYLLHVPGYSWYYYPLWPLIALSAGVGIEFVSSWAARRESENAPERWWPHHALVLGLTFFCAMNLFGPYNADQWNKDKYMSYALMADCVRQHVRPNETVMMSDIGQIGYMSDCRVVDSYGLVHDVPDRTVFPDWGRVVEHFRPDYLLNLGWTKYCGPQYIEEVPLGKHMKSFPLSDGSSVVYRQIDYRRVGDDHLPVLMKRAD